MGEFLLIAAIVVISAFVANTLLNFLSRSNRWIFVGATLAIVGIGAYAASFVLDLMMMVWTDRLAASSTIWPCLIWSSISASSLVVATGRRVPFAALAFPFFLFGGIAMLSSLIHTRNIVISVVMILAGVAYASLTMQRNMTAPGSRGEDVGHKIKHGLAPEIGPYRLNMMPPKTSLVELTQAEKKSLNAAIAFRDERIVHAPTTEFAGVSWQILLGIVGECVYKVSALAAFEDRSKGDQTWANLEQSLQSRLGPPPTSGKAIVAWDTEDGNVVLNRAEAGGAYVVVITLTSQKVSTFVRVK